MVVTGGHRGSVVRGRTHGQRRKPSSEAAPPAPEQQGHGEEETLCREPVSEDTKSCAISRGASRWGPRRATGPCKVLIHGALWLQTFASSNAKSQQVKLGEKPHLVKWLNLPKCCPQGLRTWPQFVHQVVHCLPRQCKAATAERRACTLSSFTPTADPTI